MILISILPTMNERALTLDGPAGPLEALLHESPEPTAVSVVAHPHPLYGGTMRNLVVERSCRVLSALGQTVLRFNFRGVGSSAGVHDDGAGEVLDLLRACECLEQITGRSVDLAVGYSFGAAVLLRALERELEHPRAALLIAPPLAFGDYSFVGELGSARPMALLCGGADDLTPTAELTKAESWPGLVATRILDGAGHDLGAGNDPQGFDQALESLVSQLSSPADAADSTGTDSATAGSKGS